MPDRLLTEATRDPWPSMEVTRWGGWHVIQNDPALYRWKPPPHGHRRDDNGVRMCARCIGRFRHTLSWPEDAYFRFDTPEGLLWAWTEPHAHALADFLASKDRTLVAPFAGFLRHIPKAFLDHRARERVVRAIRSELATLT